MPRGSTASTAEDASTSVDRRRRRPRDSDRITGPITATGWRPAARRSPRRAAAQTYGCLYSVDKRVPLGLDGFNAGGGGQSLDNFRLADPYVAFGCGGNLIHGCWVGVDVVDLRDGSVHRPNLDTSLGGAFGTGAGPTDVELKDNGSVAWIAGRDGDPREVGALDANGHRVLDRGTGIQPDLLTLDGSILSWRTGPDVRSTTLD